MRTRISNNVERGRQSASTSFNISENKRDAECIWLLKQSFKAFKLIQHRFNFVSICFNAVERGKQKVSKSLFDKIERMLKQMLKPFAGPSYFINEPLGAFLSYFVIEVPCKVFSSAFSYSVVWRKSL